MIILFGENESTTAVPRDARKFRTLIKNNYLLYFDNFDENINPEILEDIASVSTIVRIACKALPV